MEACPFLSLIVPTRQRPEQLRRFLDSIQRTISSIHDIEIILVVDADDVESSTTSHETLRVRSVIVEPGQTMGALNSAGISASRGQYVILLNDDVVVRTIGWDKRIRTALRRFRDDIVLVHVNDTLFCDRLCTFPLVSRTFYRLAGGIIPGYHRYRIDDHIEDIFNMLAALGKRRTLYFPDLVFAHLNTVERSEGDHVYASDPAILARDDKLFFDLAERRKDLVLRLLEHIEGPTNPRLAVERRQRLADVNDPFLLRLPGRQRVELSSRLRHIISEIRECKWLNYLLTRWRFIAGTEGTVGLLAALGRRIARLGAAGMRASDLRRAADAARFP